jgi:hypothetical protein
MVLDEDGMTIKKINLKQTGCIGRRVDSSGLDRDHWRGYCFCRRETTQASYVIPQMSHRLHPSEKFL